MVDVKTAVKNSLEFFHDLMDPRYTEPRLEEVEFSDDERFWPVTLSAVPPESSIGEAELSTMARFLRDTPPPRQRVYKIFTVDAADGTVRSMKMR